MKNIIWVFANIMKSMNSMQEREREREERETKKKQQNVKWKVKDINGWVGWKKEGR